MVLSKDTVLLSFSPSGWDNEKKIGILHENFTTVRPEVPFEDFITKPPVRKVQDDKCREKALTLQHKYELCKHMPLLSFSLMNVLCYTAGTRQRDKCGG